jgi:hypothetical protein
VTQFYFSKATPGNENKSNKSNPFGEVVGGILDAEIYRRERTSTPIGGVHMKKGSTEIARKEEGAAPRNEK